MEGSRRESKRPGRKPWQLFPGLMMTRVNMNEKDTRTKRKENFKIQLRKSRAMRKDSIQEDGLEHEQVERYL